MKLIALMVFFTIIALAPSPLKKVTPIVNAIPVSTVQTHAEAAQPLENKTAQIVQVDDKTPHVEPDVQPEPIVQEPAPIQVPIPEPTYPTDHIEIMSQAGVAPSDYSAVEYVISHESGWRYWVKNNEGSGATGLCQALPASKMASAGADYLTNPVTQMKWCDSYAKSRYGTWANAMATGIARDTTGTGWGWW